MFAWAAERSADDSEEPSPVCGGAHRDRSEDSLEEEAPGRKESFQFGSRAEGVQPFTTADCYYYYVVCTTIDCQVCRGHHHHFKSCVWARVPRCGGLLLYSKSQYMLHILYQMKRPQGKKARKSKQAANKQPVS